MTTCDECGSELLPNAKFCNECGAAQAKSCAECGSAVPPSAKFCNECGAPQQGGLRAGMPSAAQVPLDGPVSARRVTSVLFGDLVGFTTLSESRDQEDVRELLSRYFDACRTVMQRYGGTVEKFIGDAVMAVWGVPVAHEDDAERAVRAGLEIIDAVHALRDETGVPGLDMRVGIVTGEVAVTIGAVAQGMVAGDPVNTASRVQSVASPGQVWVDETTRLLTHAAITFEDAGSFVLKGKADPVPLWAATAVVANVGGGQRADGLEAPLIGRTAELRLVKEVFHRTQESHAPNLLLVSAEPGLGKSRLGWEFSKYTDGLSDIVRWLEGRCPAYGEGLAFYALAEALRGRLRSRVSTGEADPTAEPDLGRLLDDFLIEFVTDPSQRPWLRARTATLLGLPGAGTYPRDELFAAWVTVLEPLATASSGVVLVIDDAQNADDGLLDFLEFALKSGRLPLFMLLLTRPELLARRPALMANPRVVTAHLQPLSPAETGELLASLVSGLSDPLRAGLAERAEGVPLYAVETVRSLIDRDVVVPQGGRYVLADPDLDLTGLAAPASLQALVASRLDALPADQRQIVDLASVLGRSFDPSLLRALVERPDLDSVLEVLVRRQILAVETNRLAGEFGWYSFSQDVVRQVAYAGLARRDRKEAHLAVAAAMGDTATDTSLPVLGHHLLSAADAVPTADDADDLREQACAAYEAAGLWTVGMSAFAEATSHFTRAADLVGDRARRAGLLCRVLDAKWKEGMFPGGLELAERVGGEAQALFAALDDEDGQARAVGLTARLLASIGHAKQGADLVGPWWERYKDRPAPDDTMHALASAAAFCALLTQGAGLSDAALIAMKAASRVGDTPSMSSAVHSLYVGLARDGYLDLTEIVMAGLAEFARRHELPSVEATVLGNFCSNSIPRDLLEAEATGQQALAMASELKHSSGIMIGHYNLAVIRWALGRWTDLGGQMDHREALGYLAPVLDGFVALVRTARGDDSGPIDPTLVADDPTAHDTVVVMEAARTGGVDLVVRREAIAAVSRLLEGGMSSEEFCTPFSLATDTMARTADTDGLASLRGLIADVPIDRLPPQIPADRLRLLATIALHRDGPTADVAAGLEAAVTAYRKWGGTLYERRTQAQLAGVLDSLGRHGEAQELRATVREFYTEIGASAWLAALDGSSVTAP